MAKISTSAALKLILDFPLFSGVSPTIRKGLKKTLRVEHLSAGMCFLIEEDSSADDLFFVLSGEVALTAQDRLLVLNSAPDLIGLLSVLDGTPRTASATAFSDVSLGILSRDAFLDLMANSPRFARNVIEHLTRTVRNLHSADEKTRLHFDDHFDSPNARLVPGPYAMENADMQVFVMHGAQTAQERLLPPGVRPLPGFEDRWLLVTAYYPNVYSLHPGRHAQPVAYAETAPYLPCLLPDGSAALFCLEAYPDNYMAIFLGRELYGFPRRFGMNRRSERHIDLNVDNRLILRAGWQSSESVSEPATVVTAAFDAAAQQTTAMVDFLAALTALCGEQWPVGKGPALPILVRNQVPDIQHSDGDRLRIDELIALPIRVSQVSEIQRLHEPYVRRFAHDWMLGGRCVGALRLRITMTLGHAERVHNYLDASRTQARTDATVSR